MSLIPGQETKIPHTMHHGPKNKETNIENPEISK